MADNENPLSEINWQTIISSFDDPLTLLQWLKKIVEEQGSQTITSLSIEAVDAGVVKFVITMENGDTIESENFTYVTPSALSTALAGKLDKVTGSTTNQQVYTKSSSGSQEMVDVSQNADAYTMARRGSGGILKVGTPSADADATTKKYVDDADATKLDKVTSTATRGRVYFVDASGNNQMYEVAKAPTGETIVARTNTGAVRTATPTGNDEATPKSYVDSFVSGTNDGTNWLTITIGGNTYAVTGGGGGSTTWGAIIGTVANQTDLQNALNGKLDKDASTTTYLKAYTKKPNGSQNLTDIRSANAGDSIMARDSNGCSQVSTPSADNDIANKKYVDDAVAGAVSPHLYRHNIRLYLASTYDITLTYISNSDTAITGSTIADLFPSGASRSASGGFVHSTRTYSVVRLTRGSATEFTVYGVGNDSAGSYDEQDDDFTYAGATVTDVVETIL